jgi:aspartyl protease family protein
MQRIALTAFAGFALAALVTVGVVRMERARHAPAPSPVAQIPRADDGHYWVTGEVGDRRIRFLVDTGATTVSLTPQDARLLGLDPERLAYRYQVSTADGHARAAKVRLTSLSVAGATLRDVDALVIEKGLPASLLGMTYLGRLSRFEAGPEGLVLRN